MHNKIISVAEQEIGYHEQAGKHNKYGQWFGMDRVPWCVIFAAGWCYYQAGIIGNVVGRTFKQGGLYSCSQTLNWYKEHEPDCIKKQGTTGCLVIMDFPRTKYTTDHMGIFVGQEGNKIITIDGNTSNESEGNGGWVQLKKRSISYANPIFIVPKELSLEDAEVKRYNTVDEIKASAPWALQTVLKLIDAGALTGKSGWYDENGYPTELDLSEDMLRVFAVTDRMGAYDGK